MPGSASRRSGSVSPGAAAAIVQATGEPPVGWHTRSASSPNTRALLVEAGFLYDSDAYNDDTPYFVDVGARRHLVLPYAFDTNDMQFQHTQRFATAGDFADYVCDAFDWLRREGRDDAENAVRRTASAHDRPASAASARWSGSCGTCSAGAAPGSPRARAIARHWLAADRLDRERPMTRELGETEIHEILSRLLLAGRLAPGTKLVEQGLAACFRGIARTGAQGPPPARLRAPARTHSQPRGIRRRPDPGTGAPALRRAPHRRSRHRAPARRVARKEQLAAVQDHHRQEEAAAAADDRPTSIRLSGAFHLLLASMTGSDLIARQMQELVSRTAMLVAFYEPGSSSVCGCEEHASITHALARRDPLSAARSMNAHLSLIETRLRPLRCEVGAAGLETVLDAEIAAHHKRRAGRTVGQGHSRARASSGDSVNARHPVRVLLINPNVSADMTGRIAAAARPLLPSGTELVTETARFGATVIASRASYAIAGHAALDCYARHAGRCDAVILACFGDPGLEALREVADVPVFGLLASAVRLATAGGRTFGIVTAGAPWRAMLAERIAVSGETARLRGIETLRADGLTVSRDPDGALAAIAAAIQSLAAAGADTVILGGAAMVQLASRLNSPVPLVDCLKAAVIDLVASFPAANPVRAQAPAIDVSNLSAPLSRLLSGRN